MSANTPEKVLAQSLKASMSGSVALTGETTPSASLDREAVIAALVSHVDELKSAGLMTLYLFGSYARQQPTLASDVDLFFDRLPDDGMSLLDLMAIQDRISEIVGAPVDLMTRTSLHPVLKDGIERSAIRVY